MAMLRFCFASLEQHSGFLFCCRMTNAILGRALPVCHASSFSACLGSSLMRFRSLCGTNMDVFYVTLSVVVACVAVLRSLLSFVPQEKVVLNRVGGWMGAFPLFAENLKRVPCSLLISPTLRGPTHPTGPHPPYRAPRMVVALCSSGRAYYDAWCHVGPAANVRPLIWGVGVTPVFFLCLLFFYKTSAVYVRPMNMSFPRNC